MSQFRWMIRSPSISRVAVCFLLFPCRRIPRSIDGIETIYYDLISYVMYSLSTLPFSPPSSLYHPLEYRAGWRLWVNQHVATEVVPVFCLSINIPAA
ncbi:hypothetical protein C8Q69DRAFT_450717 [Paecilomyces variotii]|uniref:Uncharacterized protein n=1 Tax=Byssochlamys spectabilis TaxID=264951 RepID=A0A443I5R3_BYSSP|nr:hypothetical protein C8Q69DRAFT_450717 [Paecilomyces variotii]RWQ99325.1 hypothetical protein C8Q69DRAFT_450717 [Paecilomyces variotii]